MLRVDPEKVEAEIVTMVASLAGNSEGNGPESVIARMQMQVLPALIRWKIGEMNRGVDYNGVLNALVALCSSQMVSIIIEVVGDPDVDEAHFKLANRLLQAIGEEVGAIMTGEREMVSHHIPAERTH